MVELVESGYGVMVVDNLVNSDKEAIRRQIDSGAADSVLGDREAAVGTYREIVIFDADQVYPEYRGRWAGIG